MNIKIKEKLSIDMKTHGDIKERLAEFLTLSRRTPTDVTLEALDRLMDAELPLLRELDKMRNSGKRELTVTPQKTLSEAELEAAKKLSSELEKPIKRKKKRQ